MAISIRASKIQTFSSYLGGYYRQIWVDYPTEVRAGDMVLISFASWYHVQYYRSGWNLLDYNYTSYASGFTYWKTVTEADVAEGRTDFTHYYVDSGRYSVIATVLVVAGAGSVEVLGKYQGGNYYYYGVNTYTPWDTSFQVTSSAKAGSLVCYLYAATQGAYSSPPAISPPPTSSRGSLVVSRSGASVGDPQAAAAYSETLGADLVPPITVNTTFPQTGSSAGWYMLAVTFGHKRVYGSSAYVQAAAGSGVLALTTASRLQILDPTLIQAPTALTVTVDGLTPNSPLRFYIDGQKVYEAEIGDDNYLGPTSIPVDEARGTIGTHTLTASQVGGDVMSATFTMEKAPTLTVVTRGPDADPVPVPGAVTPHGTRKWVLQDLMPGGLGSYVMPVSPFEMDNPEFERLLSAQHTTALSGQYHVYEGGYAPLEWSFKGYVPTQEMHDKLIAFANLNRRFYLIDHRNRAWKVAFAGIDMVPRLRQVNIYGVMTDSIYDYEASVLIYDQEWVTP